MKKLDPIVTTDPVYNRLPDYIKNVFEIAQDLAKYYGLDNDQFYLMGVDFSECLFRHTHSRGRVYSLNERIMSVTMVFCRPVDPNGNEVGTHMGTYHKPPVIFGFTTGTIFVPKAEFHKAETICIGGISVLSLQHYIDKPMCPWAKEINNQIVKYGASCSENELRLIRLFELYEKRKRNLEQVKTVIGAALSSESELTEKEFNFIMKAFPETAQELNLTYHGK